MAPRVRQPIGERFAVTQPGFEEQSMAAVRRWRAQGGDSVEIHEGLGCLRGTNDCAGTCRAKPRRADSTLEGGGYAGE